MYFHSTRRLAKSRISKNLANEIMKIKIFRCLEISNIIGEYIPTLRLRESTANICIKTEAAVPSIVFFVPRVNNLKYGLIAVDVVNIYSIPLHYFALS